MHRLLRRQLNKAHAIDGDLRLDVLLKAINDTYSEYEADRARLERASRLMSEELGEMNAALELRRADAENANTAKSQFLANMSHEIRTPLNGVIALADALISTDLSDRQRDMIALVRTSGITLERLLTDILDLSKIEAGKLDISIDAFDLRECVEAAAHVLRAKADEKGIAFKVAYGSAANGSFMGDAVRIRQIISNLSSNAIKFTSQGAVAVRVDVAESTALHASPLATITVSDTGIGFDEATGGRLFGRFEQADSSITRNFGGSGLGLAISRSLAQAMGGDITATSVPGEGSVFKVTMPLARSEPLERAEETQDLSFGTQDLGRLHFLIVEDNAFNRRVAQLLLGPSGARLTFAEDGAKGVEAFKTGRFDVVLMDMQMPVMDGLTATRAARAWERETRATRTPIIILSANAMEEQVTQSFDAGADLHVPKPYTLDTLSAGVKKVLADDEWVASGVRQSA